MKRVMKVLGIVILVAVVVVVALVVKGYIQSKKPSVREDYYTEFSSPCPLEQKYRKDSRLVSFRGCGHRHSVSRDPRCQRQQYTGL